MKWFVQHLAVGMYAILSSLALAQSPPAGFTPLFDGSSLRGWRSVPAKHQSDWSVKNGMIIGTGSKNRLVYLVWKEQLDDFELLLSYRMKTKGNSGVEIRARVDQTGKRPFEGYHADFGHVGIGPNVSGAWDFHFAKRMEPPCPRGKKLTIASDGTTKTTPLAAAVQIRDIHRGGWNRLHIVARKNRCRFSLNGKPAAEFTDKTSQWLRFGYLGLQIHDAGMVVQFKDILLKKLSSSKDNAKPDSRR